MNIGDRIQTLRKLRGISQEELADKIGVSRQSVSKWESEQSTPDLVKVILLSDFFETTTDYLLKGIAGASECLRCRNRNHPHAAWVWHLSDRTAPRQQRQGKGRVLFCPAEYMAATAGAACLLLLCYHRTD